MKILVCFRLYLSYKGQGFNGFQEQPQKRTVEGELKRALAQIVKHSVKIAAAGRTDAGVHAKGQVVSVELLTKMTSIQLMLALFSLLPKDLAVHNVDMMPLGFNARRHSVGKKYIYRIYQGLIADPFLGDISLHVKNKLDVEMMKEGARYFLGEHNFASFRSSLCRSLHAHRYIWQVDIINEDPIIIIDIRGNAFCQNMVRIMVGSLIEIGRGKKNPSSIKEALLGLDRNLAGITAKAHGLSLEKVFYPDDLTQANIPINAQFPRYPVTKESWPF